jgi:hypothetical protein
MTMNHHYHPGGMATVKCMMWDTAEAMKGLGVSFILRLCMALLNLC